MKPLILIFTLLTTSFASNIEPNTYTKEGYCVVTTLNQKVIGLNRFETKEQFISKCKGKMIFKYKKDTCRYFTMKNMKFNIIIEDKNSKEFFEKGEIKRVCGKTIIESLPTKNYK